MRHRRVSSCVLLAVCMVVALQAWAAPNITSINPTSGAPFTPVTIVGTSFGNAPGFVTFNGAAAQVVSWSATKIQVKAPDGIAGSGPVKVNNQGNEVTFSFTPTIAALVPSTIKPGWAFGIVGENFGTKGTATLNGTKLTTVLWSNFLVLAVAPSNAATGPVVITTSVGTSNAVTLTVKTGTLPLTISAVASPPANANGWNNSNVIVTFTCNGGVAPVQCPAAQTISNEGANQVVTGTAKDSKGTTATTSVTINLDKTSPSIVAKISPTPNSSGWNNTSPVTVSFTCSDTLSGIAVCPSPQTITAQGAGQTVTAMATDKAGNTATATATVNLETALPAVTAKAAPAPNSAGWNNSPVTVSFTCTASISPLNACPGNQTISTEGQNQKVSGTVTDAAGNSATATVSVNLDHTAPVLAITAPANGATVTASPVSVSGTVSDALSGVASVSCNVVSAALSGGSFSCNVPVTLGANVITVVATDVAGNSVSQQVSVTYSAPPAISSFTPPSAPVGTLVIVSGQNLLGTSQGAQVTLAQQGGGTIAAPVSSSSANALSFVIPAGAATGPITVTVNGQIATSSTSLTVTAASNFSLAVGPNSVTLLPGQTTTVEVSLASTNGFSQLATLGLSGLPSGITANFQPQQITAGQFAILSFTAPATQQASTSSLVVSASAIVQGVSQMQSAPVSLNVQPVGGSTAFAGRVAVTDAYDTPLEGVTVSFTGKNYTGAQTGCTGSTTTDAAGNFVLNSLSDSCTGPQLIEYDPSTVISPPGKYSGVTLSYVLTPGQVATPGLIVHLPRVDNAETIMVSQNSSSDQTIVFKSINNLAITVYAGTTFSLADGTQPNPFPLSVVEIPYDKIPDFMPPNPTQDPVFAMSIEPFNSSSSQPIAVSYPNRKNSPPGTNMPLTSLNPTLGMMVNYGTGTVSADGTQVIPDPDPANPGHLYGISHFDWHFPLPNPKNNTNPCPGGSLCGNGGDPVDLSSGLLVITKTDIMIGNARGGVSITRTYRGLTPSPGPFGIGTNHNYGLMLDTTNVSQGLINLIMPDGNQLPFSQQAAGTFANTTIPSLQGATISNLTCITTSFGSGCGGTLRWKNGTQYVFQPLLVGQPWIAFLMSITDVHGNTVTLVHSQSIPMEITQIVDPVGRSLNLNYDNSYRITSIADPIGRSVLYAYNTQGTLASVTDPAGGVTQYAYDVNNNLTSITDPRGITFLTNTFDSSGRVIKQVDGVGGVTTFTYTPLNSAVSTTLLAAPAFSAATGGNAVVGAGPISGVNTSPVAFTTVTDPLGNATTYHFNSAGFPADITDALGQKTVFNTDPSTNQLVSITDSLGRTTAYTYDSAGNTTSVTRLSGTSGAVTTSLTYDPIFNKLQTVTDPLVNTTSFNYDPNTGNLVSVTDPLNQTSTFVYDGFGEIVSAADPLSNTTHFSYANGDLTQVTDPLGRIMTRAYDPVSRVISTTNTLGEAVTYLYNPLNQLTQITDPAGHRTSLTYDPNGNLTSLTDANGHISLHTYDPMDRLIQHTDPLLNTDSNQYDLDGNVVQATDRKGTVTKYTYDALNRRTGTDFGPGQSSIAYTYDAGDRVTQVVDSSSGNILRQFDGLDRLVSEATSLGTINYAFDGANRRTSMQVSGQSPVQYTYDNGDRLTHITQGSSNVSFSYDAASRRTSVSLPNGVVTSYTYDAGSQLTSVDYRLGTADLGNLIYSYDVTGRRVSLGGTSARTGLPQAVNSATYNANNQLTQWGGRSLSYDANGNLLNDGVNTYAWDARNHLISVNGSSSAGFQYDPFGRRIGKSLNLSATKYMFDGANSVQEIMGGASSASILTGLLGDENFQRTDSTGSASFLTDVLGSTVAQTGSGGNMLAQYTYDPFGNTTVVGNSANPAQFTGRENDSTGLYYYRARYYSPVFQRFISEDPYGFRAGPNLYTYANNDPVDFVDPLGLFSSDVHYQLAYDAAIAAGYSREEADRIATEDVMADFAPNSQDTDAFDANLHAMAGKKPNGRYQNCNQAVQGTADRLAGSLMADELGPALHTVQDAQAGGHKFKEWHGGMPSLSHEIDDFLPSSDTYQTAFDNSVRLLKDYRNGTVAQDLTSYLRGKGPLCGGFGGGGGSGW